MISKWKFLKYTFVYRHFMTFGVKKIYLFNFSSSTLIYTVTFLQVRSEPGNCRIPTAIDHKVASFHVLHIILSKNLLSLSLVNFILANEQLPGINWRVCIRCETIAILSGLDNIFRIIYILTHCYLYTSERTSTREKL